MENKQLLPKTVLPNMASYYKVGFSWLASRTPSMDKNVTLVKYYKSLKTYCPGIVRSTYLFYKTTSLGSYLVPLQLETVMWRRRLINDLGFPCPSLSFVCLSAIKSLSTILISWLVLTCKPFLNNDGQMDYELVRSAKLYTWRRHRRWRVWGRGWRVASTQNQALAQKIDKHQIQTNKNVWFTIRDRFAG